LIPLSALMPAPVSTTTRFIFKLLLKKVNLINKVEEG
jgi:hypothetical protein